LFKGGNKERAMGLFAPPFTKKNYNLIFHLKKKIIKRFVKGLPKKFWYGILIF